jgi:phosphoglycolate phosphatase (TIGR01487 family)
MPRRLGVTGADGGAPPFVRPDLLAVDFDGTVRGAGTNVSRRLIHRLISIRKAGTRVVLVTGRCIPELEQLIDISLFDAIVAENGTIVLIGGKKTLLAPRSWGPVRAKLMKHFERGCEEVVISTDRDQEARAFRVVKDMAKIELNKNRIMIMPKGLDKGSGLAVAIGRLGAEGSIASIGDGENDLSMFRASDYKVALENSVDALKRQADYTATLPNGEGVVEAIDCLFPSNRGRTQAQQSPRHLTRRRRSSESRLGSRARDLNAPHTGHG